MRHPREHVKLKSLMEKARSVTMLLRFELVNIRRSFENV